MLSFLFRRSSRPHWLLFLIISSLVNAMPVPPVKRASEEIPKAGFSNVPKILEIQLPLKIASKEDLVAWAKYVMGLTASKINITLTTVKDSPLKSPENTGEFPNRNRQNTGPTKSKLSPSPSFPQTGMGRVVTTGSRNVRPADGSFVNPNLVNSFGPMFNVPPTEFEESSFHGDSITSSALRMKNNDAQFLPSYPDFGTRPQFDLDDNDLQKNSTVIVSRPSGMYLPLPVRAPDKANYRTEEFAMRNHPGGGQRNFSGTQSASRSSKPLTAAKKPAFDKRGPASPVKINELAVEKNASGGATPVLTLPFEAVITITRDGKNEATTSKSEKTEYFAVPDRMPADEFPPYFEKNFTLSNESGQINVVFDDLDQRPLRKDTRNDSSKSEKDETKADNQKKSRSKNQQSKKRQPFTITDLARVLGLFRRPNSTSEAKRGSIKNSDEFPRRQSRRNATSAAQELEDDDDDDEEEGGSIQNLLDVLPLIAPILEDLSDPESDVDIADIIQGAIPILEGLSEDDDGQPIDIPGLLVPVLMNSSGGKDGEGSDPSAVLGPVIQLIAPLIGPIIGPLLGPLSQSSGNPNADGGSSLRSLIEAFVGPLSTPTGPGKMSPFSNLVAGIVADLSKDLINGKSGLDVKNFVSAIVSGVLAGASAGLSSKGYGDTAVAPTSYGGYGGYGPSTGQPSMNPFVLIGSSIKDVISAGLKAASSLIAALTGILGASSSEPRPYGPPPNYAPPPPYKGQTNAAFTQNKNRQSQSSKRPIRPR